MSVSEFVETKKLYETEKFTQDDSATGNDCISDAVNQTCRIGRECRSGLDGGGVDAKLTDRKKRLKFDTCIVKPVCSTFQTIDNCDYSFHFQAKFARPIDGCKAAAAGCHDILKNDRRLARFDWSFNLLTRPVFLGFFSNDKPAQLMSALMGDRDYRGGNGVRPDRHPANGIGKFRFQQLQNSFGHHIGSFAIKRQFSAIEVKIGGLTGCERKLTGS